MGVNRPPNLKRDLILGTWYLDFAKNAKGYLLLKKEPVYPISAAMCVEGKISGRGQCFEFRDNGDLVDAYADECGSSPAYHIWSGKWVWNEEEQSLFLNSVGGIRKPGGVRFM